MPSEKKFYLTTPIYYVNARPHIGHAYSTIVADVIARRHRLLGDDTYFLTGTDEHGQKIERSASAAGLPPQQFADQVSKTFSDLWKRMGITHDDFIRTTSERHKKGVQKLFATLQANGAIYLDTYTGQYCVSDEAYVDGPPGVVCPDCGNVTETVSESNYYFKLSEYQEKLIELIESDTLEIKPESRKREILSFICGTPPAEPIAEEAQDVDPAGESFDTAETQDVVFPKYSVKKTKDGRPYVTDALRDLSISRTSFKWGIPVPGDEAHVIYVWLDALANYMTAVGYGSDATEDIAKFERYWPADLHLVGKEIIRFHCVYWPAFLMAANLPLPKSIVANGWLLFEESKMSKSRGNVVRTETILDAFGTLKPELSKPEQDLFATDVLRYFLVREIPFGRDGSFSFDALVTRYNADLANGYGNLVSRTLSLILQNQAGTIVNAVRETGDWLCKSPPPARTEEVITIFRGDTGEMIRELGNIAEGLSRPLKEMAIINLESDVTNFSTYVSVKIGMLDAYLTANAPWKLAKSDDPVDRERMNEVLYTAAESIRIITALLYPILPYATASVWSQLGLGDIEAAAKRGDLNDLKWGGLQPGTKLGPLSPIFPRADKGLIQTMIDTEERNAQEAAAAKESASKPAEPSTNPGDPPLDSETWASTAPDSPPRTGSFTETTPGAHVAASAAITTERPDTPPHTEAPASAPFANAAAASAIPDTPQIAIDDFVKIDLRVARILVAERIPKADKLLRLEVDLGYEKRQILSGIAEWYTPEELVGRTIVIIANLAPRKMRGLESHGMLLAASHGENGKPVLATFGEEIALGSRLR